MTITKTAIALALVLGTALGGASAALAQSAYTTGTIASNERAGYPSPEPYGSGLYAYAPGYRSAAGPNASVPNFGYGADGRTHVLRGQR
jgi:hypothetical protein